MSIRNQNWYNANETRRYPLDEQSTGLDDSGAEIRDNIIADCNIKFSAALGAVLYVQGVTVSAGIVSVVFGVADTIAQTTGATVAAVTIPQPVVPYRHYPITAIHGNIDGWVVFGGGVAESCAFKFSRPAQSFIAARSASAYATLPIPHIKKANVAAELDGEITFEGLAPLIVKYEKMAVGDDDVDALVFKLDTQLVRADYNPLTEFLGSCGGRPDSQTCGKDPIESINGIEPDCDGNIVIEFQEPLVSSAFYDCGGIGLDLGIGLNELCTALEPKKPQEFTDKCCALVDRDGNEIPQDALLVFSTLIAFPTTGVATKYYLAFDTNLIYRWTEDPPQYAQIIDEPIDPFCWPKIENVDPDIINNEDLNITRYPCITPKPCYDFIHCSLTNESFVVETGTAERGETVAPPPCPYCDDSVAPGGNHGVLTASNVTAATVYALKVCRTDWFYGQTFRTELQLPYADDTYERVGGLVLNYYYEQDNFRVVTKYFAVVLNRDNNSVQVIGYTGNGYVNLSTTYVNLSAFSDDDWFAVSATVSGAAGGVGSVSWSLSSVVAPVSPTGATGQPIASGVTVVPALYFTNFGLHGLYARRAIAHFNNLQVN